MERKGCRVDTQSPISGVYPQLFSVESSNYFLQCSAVHRIESQTFFYSLLLSGVSLSHGRAWGGSLSQRKQRTIIAHRRGYTFLSRSRGRPLSTPCLGFCYSSEGILPFFDPHPFLRSLFQMATIFPRVNPPISQVVTTIWRNVLLVRATHTS